MSDLLPSGCSLRFNEERTFAEIKIPGAIAIHLISKSGTQTNLLNNLLLGASHLSSLFPLSFDDPVSV